MFHTRSPVLFLGVILASPLPGWAAAPEGCADGACRGCAAPRCAAPPRKTCEPVPDVVKHTKTVYTCTGADFCVTKRSLRDLLRRPGGKRGCCENCGECGCDCGCDCPTCSCPQCECRARHKTVLLKNVVTTECPSFKCEPVCCPESCPGCGSPWFESAPLPQDTGLVPGDMSPPKKAVPVPPSASVPRRSAKKAR